MLATQHYLGTELALKRAGMAPAAADIGAAGTTSLFGEESDAISDVAAVADLAVKAAESAAEAVSSVASTASEASADAAEAASALKSAGSGFEFIGTMVWLTVDVFIALIVYWFAKRRFA